MWLLAVLLACTPDDPTPPLDTSTDAPWWHAPWQPDVPAGACERAAPMADTAAKAALYDHLGATVSSLPPSFPHSRVLGVTLAGPGPTTLDATPPATLYIHEAENSGLWNGLYVASQAWRYQATGDPDALATVRRSLEGVADLFRVTGVPGLPARDLRGIVPEMPCPVDPAEYVPPGEDRVGNRWVMVGPDGCHQIRASADADWSPTGVCVDVAFAGQCFQANASQDELSGHLFAMMTVARAVDDPAVRALAAGLLGEIAHHLVDHGLRLHDWDGKPTRFGDIRPLGGADPPGFASLIALAAIRAGATVTGDPALENAFLCLLDEGEDCPPEFDGDDVRELLHLMGIRLGCLTNYDNPSMAALAFSTLMLADPDPARRATWRQAWLDATWAPGDPTDLQSEGNAFRDVITAAFLEGEEGALAAELAGSAACAMVDYAPDPLQRAHDNSVYPEDCVSPRHGSRAADPIPVADQCQNVFLWWGDLRAREVCGDELAYVHPPAGYLLPYWMGRALGMWAE